MRLRLRREHWLSRLTTLSPRSLGRIPFIGPIPGLVLVFGLLAAIAITSIGVVELKQQSDGAAMLRSKLLATTLAQRLAKASANQRSQWIEQAAMRSGAELLLVAQNGQVHADGMARPPSQVGIVELLRVRSGETQTAVGNCRFFAAHLPAPADSLSLVTFVAAPTNPIAAESLIHLVAAFTLILLGVAAVVAYALARDVQSDVSYVSSRIGGIAEAKMPAGSPIRVRSLDQVGAMTNAFNQLVQRFAQAQSEYRDDLQLAVTIERDRSAFLAALSHELKTPLNVILGFTDVLLAEVEGPLSDDARENLEVVRRSGGHLKQLIRDILDLSALESGEIALSRENTNVYEVADDVCRENRIVAQEKGLLLKLTGRPTHAWADPVRIRQILSNLVGNAIKFTKTGEVSVRIEPQDGGALLTVSDTGPGIASAEQATVFKDYAQVGDARARGAGTGLGLAITRRLVQMHDGQIRLTSQLGEGACFAICLPSKQRGAARSRERIEPELGALRSPGANS